LNYIKNYTKNYDICWRKSAWLVLGQVQKCYNV